MEKFAFRREAHLDLRVGLLQTAVAAQQLASELPLGPNCLLQSRPNLCMSLAQLLQQAVSMRAV